MAECLDGAAAAGSVASPVLDSGSPVVWERSASNGRGSERPSAGVAAASPGEGEASCCSASVCLWPGDEGWASSAGEDERCAGGGCLGVGFMSCGGGRGEILWA